MSTSRKKFIESEVKRLSVKMKLERYNFVINYTSKDDEEKAMTVDVDEDYLRVYIDVYPCTLKEKEEGHITS